jgi:hypothetical protein
MLDFYVELHEESGGGELSVTANKLIKTLKKGFYVQTKTNRLKNRAETNKTAH